MTMPYIKQVKRHYLQAFDIPRLADAGELNYFLTTIIAQYWEDTSDYQGINDIVGALEGAKLEFYSRIAIPYEEKKLKENGDVYP
jgi:hypothetical protein